MIRVATGLMRNGLHVARQATSCAGVQSAQQSQERILDTDSSTWLLKSNLEVPEKLSKRGGGGFKLEAAPTGLKACTGASYHCSTATRGCHCQPPL